MLVRINHRDAVFPIYAGSIRGKLGVGFFYYDEELAEHYEKEGDYTSSYFGPYSSLEKALAAANKANNVYLSL